MKGKFTSGEVAKKCKVSVRTLQYYDKEGLLKPAELSEGGRRLYSEEDFILLRCILMYKEMGFSLTEINSIVKGGSNKEFFEEILNQQQLKLDVQIEQLTKSKEKLQIIIAHLHETGSIEIHSMDQLNDLLKKKEKQKKSDVMTYLFVGCYFLITLAGFPLALSIGGISPILFSLLLFILLLSLVYYHKENSAYLCPLCHTKFSIGFSKDLFTLNGGRKGKYLKCQHCDKYSWMKETYKD